MKKIVFSVFVACLLSSCNFIAEKSELYKDTLAQRDSLQNVYDQKEQEAAEYLSIIGEVEENFAKIKAAQDVLTVNDGETATVDHRTKVQNDLNYISQLVEENKAKIAELEQKLQRSNGRFAALNSTIANLKNQLAEKETFIADLQRQIGEKDLQIKNLDSTVVVLNTNLTDLGKAKAEVDSIASEQDKDLNTGYYYFGTAKDLKASGIIIKKGINKSKFTKIDIREVATIDLKAKSGIVLTTHPAGSYKINVVDKKATLTITNPTEFWSISKYLVIKTK